MHKLWCGKFWNSWFAQWFPPDCELGVLVAMPRTCCFSKLHRWYQIQPVWGPCIHVPECSLPLWGLQPRIDTEQGPQPEGPAVQEGRGGLGGSLPGGRGPLPGPSGGRQRHGDPVPELPVWGVSDWRYWDEWVQILEACLTQYSRIKLWKEIRRKSNPPESFRHLKLLQLRTLVLSPTLFPFLKVKVKSLSRVRLFATPWTVTYQAPPSMGFSRQEYWRGLPFPSPRDLPDRQTLRSFPHLGCCE